MFEIHDASPRVGSVVRTTKHEMLDGSHAEQIKRLLVERSALAFPQMHFTVEEQLRFAATIGEVFLVGGKEVQKISLDPSINPVADYTRGAFFWHIAGGEDKVPAEAWTGTESEKACNAHQLRVLAKIGASRKQLDYMAGLDGTHSDVDGDGDYDWDDYKARDW